MVMIVNICQVIVAIIGIIFIFWTGMLYCLSKNYRANRLINCIYFNEKYDKYLSELDFCFEKGLIKYKSEDNNNLEITNNGFEYMNSQNSLFMSSLSFIVALLALFNSMIK